MTLQTLYCFSCFPNIVTFIFIPRGALLLEPFVYSRKDFCLTTKLWELINAV